MAIDIYNSLHQYIDEAHGNARDHGFWDGQWDNKNDCVLPTAVEKTIPEKLCLIHSEVSEALEAYREGPEGMRTSKIIDGPKAGKIEGFLSELADIVIRVFDLVGAIGKRDEFIEVLVAKMKHNRSRSYKHGKVC